MRSGKYISEYLKPITRAAFTAACLIYVDTAPRMSFASAPDNNQEPSCFLPSQIVASQESDETVNFKPYRFTDKDGHETIGASPVHKEALYSGPGNAHLSVVQIIAKTPQGYETGSGSIVNPSRNILTARHVVSYISHDESGDSIKDATRIAILDSRGHILGLAAPVATSDPERDLSVLHIIRYTPRGREWLDRIPGLSVSTSQRQHVMSGEFFHPAGISQGASGAPAINFMGEITGIVTKATPNIQSHGRVRVMRLTHAGKLVAINGGGYSREDVKYPLPERGTAYLEPVTDMNITKALGISVDAGDTDSPLSVFIPGYPYRHCVIYKGTIR